ncbi:MAG: tartrate dehydrogenase, partial [Planctomycetaceae bacterium]|nr:tartrate dehydrogenase [Planctomycetaceae bacterium]
MKTKNYKIAVYPGDGIGPEVIDQAIRVLRAAEEKDGTFQLEMESFPWGYEFYRQTGTVVPDNYLDVLKEFDAILLGAVGWPE